MSAVIRKVREFLYLWALSLCGMVAIGGVGLFVLLPMIVLLKTGTLSILPDWALFLAVAKGVVAGSFALTVVMWLWGEIANLRRRGSN